MMQMKNSPADSAADNKQIGVIVGRFQTPCLHEGHRRLFDVVLARHRKILVFVGVRPGNPTRRNPLDFETRRAMIESAYADRVAVFPLTDCPDDSVWDQRLDEHIRQLAPGADIKLYGSRDSFIEYYRGVFPVEFIDSDVPGCSATQIRATAGQTAIDSAEFRSGVLYGVYQRRPSVYPTVDIAIFNPEHSALLLARKPGEKRFRFPGGFADPADPDFETAALREALEECGDLELTQPRYVGSRRVDDWRYRRSEDSICTTLFAVVCTGGTPQAQDDIEALRWFDLNELSAEDFVTEHQPLYNLLKTRYLNLQKV